MSTQDAPRNRPPGALEEGFHESDPLLARRRAGSRRAKFQERQAGDSGLPPAATAAIVICGPWVSFFFFSTLFLLCNHGAPTLAMTAAVTVGSCQALGAFLSRLHDARALSLMLALCSIAVLVGSISGLYNYYRNVHNYYIYQDLREYTNVWPDELADAHRDAAAIVFTRGARPDLRMPSSFLSAGHAYCVAPVLMRENTTMVPEIQYWAIGRDCCTDREFTCDDAAKSTARAGLVVDMRTNSFSYLLPPELDRYMEAVKAAVVKFDLKSTANPIFLRWVQDLDIALNTYWDNAWAFQLEAGLVYLCVCTMMALSSSELSPFGRRSS